MDDATKEKVAKFIERLPKKVNKTVYENPTVFAPVGCVKCNGIGYKGRVGIFEFLEGGPI